MALIERGRKRQDVHFPVEHFHLLLEVVDGEGGLAAAGEVRDFEHVGFLAADAFAECAHGCLPG
jgi:hypothetical protein